MSPLCKSTDELMKNVDEFVNEMNVMLAFVLSDGPWIDNTYIFSVLFFLRSLTKTHFDCGLIIFLLSFYIIITFGLRPDPWRKNVPVINQKLFDTENWFSTISDSWWHGCGLFHSYGEKRAITNNVNETNK